MCEKLKKWCPFDTNPRFEVQFSFGFSGRLSQGESCTSEHGLV